MGSKGRIPPPHLRRPLPGPGMLHPDPFGPGGRPPPGSFPFDRLPPPEIMEQKLAAQQVEIQRLASENRRLAATHSSLRQDLAAAQQELQRLQSHMGALKADQEQQLRGLFDKISKIEAELQASEPIKLELHQARAEAQSLNSARQELISKVQQLTQDLHRSHGNFQQVPSLMAELENLRQEYQHCRATYDYEKKLRIDHYESLQIMEKNYVSMVTEVETLRTELTNLDRSVNAGGAYAGNAGYKENDTSGHQSVGNAYEDGYGVPQGRGPPGGATQYGGGQTQPAQARAGYDPQRGATYDASRNPGYDASRNPGYDASRNPGYDASRAASYEAPRGGPGYEAPRGGGGYDAPRGLGSAQAGGMAAGNSTVPYGSAQAPPASYGSAQGVPPASYGSAPAPSPYGTSVTPTRPAPPAAVGGGGGGSGGGYEGPRGGNAAARR